MSRIPDVRWAAVVLVGTTSCTLVFGDFSLRSSGAGGTTTSSSSVGGAGGRASASSSGVGGASSGAVTSTSSGGACDGAASCTKDADCTGGNDCISATCSLGCCGPSSNVTIDTTCSTFNTNQPGFCDGQGHCAQCTQASECTGTTNDCEHPSCNAQGVCAAAFTPSGTPTTVNPPQITGDCMQIQCDGKGGTMTAVDTSNLPPNTNQGCTVGTCSATGVPGSTPAADGTGCGTGLSCSGGQCAGCTMDSQCIPPMNGSCHSPNCVCTKFTCGIGSENPPADPVTCGVNIADGCNGTLNCNDNVQDGNETDVDCGGPTTGSTSGVCANRCAQGQKCKATSDCQSGLSCADGVCCNSACGGACEACTAAKKGQGANGVCGAVVNGQADPHGICTSQAASTCGDEGGTCNGSGGCTMWPSGTSCGSQACSGGMLMSFFCNGTGTCTPGTGTPGPGGYNCANGTSCAALCQSDSGCISTYYCSTGSGLCLVKNGSGVGCSANDQCLSNACSCPEDGGPCGCQ